MFFCQCRSKSRKWADNCYLSIFFYPSLLHEESLFLTPSKQEETKICKDMVKRIIKKCIWFHLLLTISLKLAPSLEGWLLVEAGDAKVGSSGRVRGQRPAREIGRGVQMWEKEK